MSFGPKPPNPTDVANAQQSYNLQGAQQQQKLNMFNEVTPFGALTYSKDTNSPSGFQSNISLSPAQQAILDNLQRSQLNTGGAANQLTSNFANQYSNTPNFADPNAITSQLMKWQQAYVNPIFQQQQSNLDAQLRNQGLTPGSTAFNNAQNLLARNQGDVTNQFLMQAQPLGFQESVANYGLPIQIAKQLQSSPQQPTFQPTPTEQIQPANYEGPAYQSYNAANQQSMFGAQGIGQLASIGLAPFTGGASLFGLGAFGGGMGGAGGGGMFSGGWG